MNVRLSSSAIIPPLGVRRLTISGSKSETNRLLLLQALYPEIEIENASNSDDSKIMQEILNDFNAVSPSGIRGLNVHHAGTAMRFLTAYFAQKENCQIILSGSSRMKERPIKILVDALRELGAEIYYEEKEGFPPLKIIGKKLSKNKVSLPANVSSQYISALLLIAPKLENGLELTLEGEITSIPYIKMTLALLTQIGIETFFKDNFIKIKPLKTISLLGIKGLVESDWSSASYWYSIVALSQIGTKITLSFFKKNSLQGDAVLVEIYKDFGVETVFNDDNSITISKIKNNFKNQKSLICNLQSTPDIAQTIAVTCFGLGINCDLTGLHTLKIKETDRLQALKTELEKFGAKVTITKDSLLLHSPLSEELEGAFVSTYQDHRMAMAFAPLAVKFPIIIEDAQVVTKSYPNFWNDLKQAGFNIEEK